MTIGDKLKKIRELRKLSMSELARISKVHRTTIHAIEYGRFNHPGIGTIERLAHALKVSPLYFFEERVITPLEAIDKVPKDLAEFLLREESLPYLLLSKEASERGISAETLEKLILILREEKMSKSEKELEYARNYDKELRKKKI